MDSTCWRRWALCAATVVAGCGDDGRETGASTTGMTMTSISSNGSSTGEALTTTTDTPTMGGPEGSGEGSSSTPSTLDTGSETTAPGSSSSEPGTTGPDPTGDDTTSGTTGPSMGCTKADFLFVVDNSVSMSDEQKALTAAFPMFMQSIQDTLTATDFHILVADTDAEGRCTQQACDGNPHATCNDYACMLDQFTACDTTRGAGVIHPAGVDASNMLCMPFGGNRYIIDGEPDLINTFSCMATVGTAGNPSERPLDGIVEALAAPINAPGGCNAGFLRDDAILVVTFFSDDGNVEDINTAQSAFDAVVAAKGGDLSKIVVLGLIPGAGQQHWKQFIAMFGASGIEGPIGNADFNALFQQAITVIDQTCDIQPG